MVWYAEAVHSFGVINLSVSGGYPKNSSIVTGGCREGSMWDEWTLVSCEMRQVYSSHLVPWIFGEMVVPLTLVNKTPGRGAEIERFKSGHKKIIRQKHTSFSWWLMDFWMGTAENRSSGSRIRRTDLMPSFAFGSLEGSGRCVCVHTLCTSEQKVQTGT